MARLTTYIKQTPSDNDLLTGSEYISTGVDGIKNYTTANYKMSDLAGYFASFYIQEGTPYNLATISQQVSTNVTDISANATYSTNLSATFGTFDDEGNLQTLAQSFANQVFSTTSSTIFAQSSYVNNLSSSFGTFDSSGNLTSLSESFANNVMTTTNNSRFAESTYVNNLGSSFGTVAADGTVTISEAFANQVFTTTSNTDFATSSSVTDLTARVGDAEGSISTQSTAIGRLDGYAEARHTMKLDANGAFAGFSILAQGGGTTDPYSEIRFVADAFKVYNGGQADLSGSYDAPFEVVGNVVKIKSANIGTVSFGDLSDVPSTFVTTVVYATDANGTSASTTQGSRTYYALIQQATAWEDGDSIPAGTVFNQITGSTGANGSDAKTIKLTSSAFVITYDAEGNNPNPSSITLTGNSTNFADGYFKFTGGGSVFTDETSFTDGTAQNQDTATVTMPTSLFSTPLEFRVGVAEASQSEDAFDTINVVAVKPGQNGFTTVLSNESHTLPAASNGNVSSYTGSGTRIIVFDGATEYDSVTGTPGNNEFSVSATVTTGTITIGSQSVGTNESVFGDHSNMNTDLAIIEYTINIENTTTVKKYQTLTKSKQGLDGADGADGSAGTDARVVNLTADDFSFEYNTSGSSPSPSSVTVTATALNTSGTVYYQFFKNDVSVQNTTSNTYSYTPQSSYSNMPDKLEVQIREGATNNPILARDQISMIGIKPGEDGISPFNAILTNEAHTLPTTNAGTVTYTGSGTVIDVYKGTTQLNSVTGTPGAGQFSVSASASNITAGSISVTGNTATVADHSNMTANNASITYSINCENTLILTKTQSFSKSIEGDDGAQGPKGDTGDTGATDATGARSITTYVFYSTATTSSPSFNSSGVTYSFSTNSFSNLPSGWSNDAPVATPGSGSNNYWHIKATVVEGSPANTITFSSVTRMFGFSGLVTFSGTTLTDGTSNFNYTTIDGSYITTGTISANRITTDLLRVTDAANTYSTPSQVNSANKTGGSVGGWVVSSSEIQGGTVSGGGNGSFTTSGIRFGSSGYISSPKFYIDTSGNAAFSGNLFIGATQLTSNNTLNSNTTKSDVGLSNVDNLSASTIQAGTTKANVGLSNVDNNSTATIRAVAAATSGTVGGWVVTSTEIQGGSPSGGGNGSFTTQGVRLGASGYISHPKFYLDTSGNAKFGGDIQVSGTALIQGTDTTNNEFTAVKIVNTGSTNGKVGMKLQNSSGYFAQFFLDTTSENNITSYGFDLQLGPASGGGVNTVAHFNAGGLCVPAGTSGTSTYNGRSIFFNSDNASRTTSSGRLHVSDYFKAFFFDIPDSPLTSGTYANKGLVFRTNSSNSEIGYMKPSTSSFHMNGDIVAYASSDKRLKDNINKLQNPLDKLEKINGYEFDWNKNQHLYEGHDIGVIAQEIEEVLPEIVETRKDGYKAVKYEKIVPLLIESIKELSDKIKALENGVTK